MSPGFADHLGVTDPDPRPPAAPKPDGVRYIESAGGVIDVAKRRAEMQVYDALGPLARAVIDASPIKNVDVPKLVVAFRQRYRDIQDPDTRSTDEQMAEFIQRAIEGQFRHLENWCGYVERREGVALPWWALRERRQQQLYRQREERRRGHQTTGEHAGASDRPAPGGGA